MTMGRLFKKSRNGTKSGPWIMRYRTHDGRPVERSTRCRDRKNAEAKLRNAEAQEEKIAAGIMSVGEAEAVDHAKFSLSIHAKDYIRHLQTTGASDKHVYERRRCLSRVMGDCRFGRLGDFSRLRFERWLAARADEGMGNRTRNTYRSSLLAFTGWMVKQGRMLVNPFDGVEAANENVDKRRQRRILTDAQIVNLLDATEERPVFDAIYKNPKTRVAKLSEAYRRHLSWLGYKRRMCYAVMVGTGLRYGETRGLRVMDVVLDGKTPYLQVKAETEKARRGAQVPLSADLQVAYLARSFIEAQRAAQAAGQGIPMRLRGTDKLFPSMPKQITRMFTMDLAHAGIAKTDEAGRTVDVHSLRHTFGTRLARAGIPLVTQQKLMRHSTPELTANTYTHLCLLDLHAAMDSIPGLPGKEKGVEAEQVAVAAGNPEKKRPPRRPLFGLTTAQNNATLCSQAGKEGAISKGHRDSHNHPILQGDSQQCKAMQEEKSGAGHGARTRDIQLGKLALYQLS
jgi:integrase